MAIRVLHVSDSHVTARVATAPPASLADAVALARGVSTADTLRQVVDCALADPHPPDLILHTGDVTDDGDVESHESAMEVLASAGVPVHWVPGNHDDSRIFAEMAPTSVHIVDLDAWRLVLVDSSVAGAEHGHLDPAQLEELASAVVAGDSWVLVAMHHPPRSSCGHEHCIVTNADEVLATLDTRSVRVVASGHLHAASHHEAANTAFLLGPSTCVQLDHIHPLEHNNRPITALGARWIDLHDDGAVETSLLWIG